ncbi:hypothetical protein BC940DRAFT_307419 [Gongronella butleri]|nr:hypothetical protein BC940DRAFT_307419 [Gongronella butleri]
MTSVSVQYNAPFSEPCVERHRSSSFMASLLQHGHPPALQPRSSSTRERALLDSLDKVDAEAGCILIALANHDKRKDMNDLIPYSIRIKDDDRIVDAHHSNSISSISSSSTSSSSGSSGSESSTSSHLGRDESVCTTTTTPSPASQNNDPSSSRHMSIRQLLGEAKATASSDPSMAARPGQQRKPSTTKKPMTLTSAYHEPSKASAATSWRQPRSDPILLLAEAARAIHDDDQQMRQSHKRKFRDDDDSSRPPPPSAAAPSSSDVPGDYPATNITTSTHTPLITPPVQQNEKNKFSYQYHSMKQNPKIKRNAMHAYITYMIYSDLAANDKKRKPAFVESRTPLPASTNGMHALNAASTVQTAAPPPPTHAQMHAGSVPSPSKRLKDQHHAPAPPHVPRPPPNVASAPTNTQWIPPPPPQQPSTPSLGPNGPPTLPSIMSRPLTAFLRDDFFAGA